MHGYLRTNSGLDRIKLMQVNGHIENIHSVRLFLTNETVVLKGWGKDNGERPVYRTEAGKEIIVIHPTVTQP